MNLEQFDCVFCDTCGDIKTVSVVYVSLDDWLLLCNDCETKRKQKDRDWSKQRWAELRSKRN